MMKVLVTGGTGFTGRFVVSELTKRGVKVRCLVRTPAKATLLPAEAEITFGDLSDRASLDKAFTGVDHFINVASLGFGHAPLIISAAEKAAVKRAVFISTTAVFTQLNAPSKAMRLAAEKQIENSQLNYVVLRPTMIYGTSADRNISRLISYLAKWPIIPVVGSGNYLQQPIYVDDLSQFICNAGLTTQASRRCFNVSGAEALTYNEVIDTISSLLQKNVRKIHFAARPIVSLLKLVENAGFKMPIKAEQVKRLNEDKAFDHKEAATEFGVTPRTFAAGAKLELQQMGLLE